MGNEAIETSDSPRGLIRKGGIILDKEVRIPSTRILGESTVQIVSAAVKNNTDEQTWSASKTYFAGNPLKFKKRAKGE